MSKNIGNELEKLFAEWKDRLKKDSGPETHFTKDGVMYRSGKTNEQVEQEWLASPKRVVFLLKDQNQGKKELGMRTLIFGLRMLIGRIQMQEINGMLPPKLTVT